MKRLLQINPVIRTNTSTGRIMQEIGDLAMRSGWESYIAYSRGRDGIRECKSKIIPIGSRLSVALHGLQTRLLDSHGLASRLATRRFIRRIEELKPDIIHIHNIHGYFLNYRILFDYLSSSGIPVIWTIHDCWLYTGHCYYYSYAGCDRWKDACGHCPQRTKFPASWLIDRSRRNFNDKRRAFTSMPKDKLTIVPVSQWIREEMASSFLKGYEFKVIHNGIDLDVFAPQGEGDVRGRYGIGSRRIILGVASIWLKEKGIGDFMKLARLISDDEVIVLVGLAQDALGKALKEYGAEDIRNRIIAVRRTENVHQLAELYSAADVFVNPTWQDNYPTVNLESIACGTPVITYRTGGSIEAISEGTGIIVAQGDVRGIYEAAHKIMAGDRDSYRSRCRTYAEEHFRKEDRYADYIKLYGDLLKPENKYPKVPF